MNNQLAIRDEMSLTDIAGAFVKSGYFQDASDVSKAVVKILAGREFGFGPFASMTNIYIIQGRPSLGANLMASAVKSNPRYDYKVRQMTDAVCEIEYFQRNGDKWDSLGVSKFTVEDARKAGTKNLDKYPRNMLFARAMSNGVRWYVPDVFGTAVYTPEELGADVNEDGDVIEGTIAEPAPSPAAKPSNGGFMAVQVLIDSKVSANEFAARELLKRLPDNLKADPDTLVKTGKTYRLWKDSGVTTQQALDYAIQGIPFED